MTTMHITFFVWGDSNAMLNMMCPHCKEGSQLKASEVERKIDRERNG
jgi:hypothetical protein